MTNGHANKELDGELEEFVQFARSDPDTMVTKYNRRGRPPMGLAKALKYSDQVWECRRSGMSAWAAVVKVAQLNRKTPEHISSCLKRVANTDPHEYLEPDFVLDDTDHLD
jgi:hypothetical protein